MTTKETTKKEPRKVDIRSVQCTSCGLPNTLNDAGLCIHCRVSLRAKDKERGN